MGMKVLYRMKYEPKEMPASAMHLGVEVEEFARKI